MSKYMSKYAYMVCYAYFDDNGEPDYGTEYFDNFEEAVISYTQSCIDNNNVTLTDLRNNRIIRQCIWGDEGQFFLH